ncbi:ABC transporter ATP-binding protein [Gibbsiella quercinecans]|uniref:ABC transporter ATP-binding protein n=1 Tax=Gibbsiella quercinecans TaxID=929813 RepID=UPI002431D508|nr:sn-glycerol-3-phosphate ABC transporter ATP-binding protein UgpC [Gibbsiella quercinecans]
MKKLELKNIQKAYGQQCVIPHVDLTVEEGEFVVFVGPSGCGKSTLLRMIAGLESVTQGEILLNGKALNGVHPSEREVAMVFQSYALYPHMSVEKNMGFPLKMAGMAKAAIAQSVRQTAENLQLTPLLNRLPGELSGGQRQRVAIGRAIVRRPQLFLFDEPLSNLDAKLRSEMRTYLKQLHQQMKATMIYVTHDQVEAMTLADKIVVLNQGRIEQIGSPEALYQQPANQFVAAFIGSPVMNFLDARLFNTLINSAAMENVATVGVRPNHVVIDAARPDCEMTISVVEPLGHARLYYGQLQGQPFIVESTADYQTGDRLPLRLADSLLHYFDAAQQRVVPAEVTHAA